jgi:hypothetical protein
MGAKRATGTRSAKQQDVRGTNGRIVRMILPFIVATATAVIVWYLSSRPSAPTSDGGTRLVDTGQPQLVSAVLAGFVALMITVIGLKLIRPRSA